MQAPTQRCWRCRYPQPQGTLRLQLPPAPGHAEAVALVPEELEFELALSQAAPHKGSCALSPASGRGPVELPALGSPG